MLTIRNVLVATDYSECSKAALDYGRSIASAFGAQLHLLHAIPPVGLDAPGGMGFVGALLELQSELVESERARLEQLLSSDDRIRLRARTELRVLEPPTQAILSYARSAGIDLIVIGTHGRRGLSRMVLGSVAEHVVRTAPCPVVTVRPPGHEGSTTHAGSTATASAG